MAANFHSSSKGSDFLNLLSDLFLPSPSLVPGPLGFPAQSVTGGSSGCPYGIEDNPGPCRRTVDTAAGDSGLEQSQVRVAVKRFRVMFQIIMNPTCCGAGGCAGVAAPGGAVGGVLWLRWRVARGCFLVLGREDDPRLPLLS